MALDLIRKVGKAMSLVKVAERITGEWEDLNGVHPYTTATLYINCDTCGSFDLRTHLGYRKISVVILACILVALGMLALLLLRDGIYGLGSSVAVSLLAFRYLWGNAEYVCRKCGSVPTTLDNSLGIATYISLPDVPERQIKKCSLGYFEEWENLEKSLKSRQPAEYISPTSKILHDLEHIKTFLLSLLAIPLFIIFFVLYPIFLIIYALWAEVISKSVASISIIRRNH